MVVISTVDVGAALEQDGGDGERWEFADRVAAHAGGVAVGGQVERTEAVLAPWLQFQKPAHVQKEEAK